MRAMRKSRVLFGVLSALVTAAAASAGGSSTPGVTAKQILIGGTTPLSGPASAYAAVAKGADAYFKYVNDHGGVFGRSIKYKYEDDAYDPSQTVQKVRDLVQTDKVFAIYNTLGTEQNLAVRSYLNQLKVPQLLVASGARAWGNDYKKYPWTIGYQPSYRGEAAIYGRYIAKTRPSARIGILYQNDAYGKELIAGLQRGLGKKDKLIVLKKYNGGEGLTDYYNVYGMSSAFTLVDALRHSGKNPTRASVMRAVTHLNERNNPFVLPGIVVKTTATNRFPITQARLERYHNGQWVYFGPLVRVG